MVASSGLEILAQRRVLIGNAFPFRHPEFISGSMAIAQTEKGKVDPDPPNQVEDRQVQDNELSKQLNHSVILGLVPRIHGNGSNGNMDPRDKP